MGIEFRWIVRVVGIGRAQSHVIHAARSHVERLVLEAFVEKVGALPDDDANRAVLDTLCDLYALSLCWFVEHGRLSSERSKSVTREIAQLCREVRPVAGALCDGFGIPEEMLDVEMLRQVAEAERA